MTNENGNSTANSNTDNSRLYARRGAFWGVFLGATAGTVFSLYSSKARVKESTSNVIQVYE